MLDASTRGWKAGADSPNCPLANLATSTETGYQEFSYHILAVGTSEAEELMRRAAIYLFPVVLAGLAGAMAAPVPKSPERNAGVTRTLEAFQAARPADSELRVFQLDWAGSLKEAKERAAQEGRPIFFVSTTQLEDAGDLKGGHC